MMFVFVRDPDTYILSHIEEYLMAVSNNVHGNIIESSQLDLTDRHNSALCLFQNV